MAAAARHAEMHLSTFGKYARALGVYLPNGAGIGLQKRNQARAIPLDVILAGGYPSYNASKLKPRLLAAYIFKDECSSCGQLPFWHGNPLKLQLDHINGDSLDHRLANLRIICPNCHSQTGTFAGKNAKRVRPRLGISDDVLYAALEEYSSIRAALKAVGLSIAKHSYERCHQLLLTRPELDGKFSYEAKNHKDDHVAVLAVRAANTEAVVKSKLALLTSAGIDYKKWGWATKAGRVVGWTPQYLVRWLKREAPEFLENCLIK